MSNEKDYKELEALARRARWLAISTVASSGAGHVGGPFSAMDMLVALYFKVMNINPFAGEPGKPRLAGPGSIHPFQGTLFDRTLHGDGPARVSHGRRAQDLR